MVITFAQKNKQKKLVIDLKKKKFFLVILKYQHRKNIKPTETDTTCYNHKPLLHPFNESFRIFNVPSHITFLIFSTFTIICFEL